jgi:hypothetical protein
MNDSSRRSHRAPIISWRMQSVSIPHQDRSGRLTRRNFVKTLAAGGAAFALTPNVWAREHFPTHAEGVVFHDRNGGGRRQRGDKGIAGVAVSNGREICITDRQGRWRLPIESEESTFFVIKPRGWMTQISAQNLPQFHYIHQPNGSPKLRFPGVAPTGPLPESVDFPLTPRREPDRFKALFCGDPQPRNGLEVGYLAQTVVPHITGSDAMFGVSLGDIMFDNLQFFEPLNDAFRLIGLPWHNVVGNHDLNFDTPDARHANETFRRVYGPTYYAFDCGPVHFILLNNVEWLGQNPEQPNATGNYRGYLGRRQLEFVANDLSLVPRDKLVVLIMHIPLQHRLPANPRVETVDRQELYALFENRPRTLSFSSHMHWHGHSFLGAEEGWRGPEPHHHIVTGTLCGSWFGGAPDERGVPHSTMSDGSPRGYVEVEFNGNNYNIDGYRALQRPREHQMNIDLPNELQRDQLGQTAVYANIFNGSERSKVRMRCGPGDQWREMGQVAEPDPAFVRLHERDRKLSSPYRGLPGPMACPHLWRAPLPEDLPAGTHAIEIVATDMFGNEHRGIRPLLVLG